MESRGAFGTGLDVIHRAIACTEIAMAAPVPLRSDFDAAQLRALAKRALRLLRRELGQLRCKRLLVA